MEDDLQTTTPVEKGKVADHYFGVKRSKANFTKGVTQTMNLWYANANIRIKFLNGTTTQQNLVKQYAADWQQYIGLNLDFVEGGQAEVRIAFDWYEEGRYVTWSYTGTDCKYVRDQNEPTANFADFDYISEDDQKGDVLRVFGQILGLELEHRHLEFDPQWRNKVQSYWEGNIEDIPWETLKEYVFDPLADSQVIQTEEFDPQSIMVWAFPKNMTRNNALWYSNYELSEKDIEFIQTLYPRTASQHGKKDQIYVELNGYDYWSGPWGTRGYDYINDVELPFEAKTRALYPTIVIGEYEWMAANLMVRYGQPDGNFEHMNLPEGYQKQYSGDACPDIRSYERVFGTWITELPHLNMTYRDPRFFKVWRDEAKTKPLPDFDMPVEADIYQLIGQMPHTTGNAVTDLLDYIMGVREDIPGVNVEELKRMCPTSYGRPNLSGLTLPPSGMNNAGQSHYSFGYGFVMRLKEAPKVFTYIDMYKFRFSNLYHWGNTRYCRQLSNAELGYRLYLDEANDRVTVLGIKDSDNVNNLPELPKGIERGLALYYMNANRKAITKSWSAIQEEAEALNAQFPNEI